MFREEDGSSLQHQVSIVYANNGMSLVYKIDMQELPKDDTKPLTLFKTDIFECIRQGKISHFLPSG